MKTINYLTSEELKSTPYCIKYFFEGESGFLKAKGLSRYFPDSDHRHLSEVLKVNEELERSNEFDFADLCNYIIKEKDQRKKRIEDLQKDIRFQQDEINKLYEIGNLIDPNKTLKENLEIILNNEVRV